LLELMCNVVDSEGRRVVFFEAWKDRFGGHDGW
jgi:hypothetical protein